MSATSTPPQELLDFLAQQGVDPGTVSYWQLLVWLLRNVRALRQQVQQNTADIATIKQKFGLP